MLKLLSCNTYYGRIFDWTDTAGYRSDVCEGKDTKHGLSFALKAL